MSATKTRISITIMDQLDKMLEAMAERERVTKSALVERSVKKMFEEKLAEEARIIASMTFDDLPTEDEWMQIQPDISEF